MSTLQDKAKEAAEARARLQAALMTCANAVVAAGDVMTASAAALAEATEKEQAATLAYVTELEQRLTQQQTVS